MANNPTINDDGWTVETLKAFYDERLEENRKRSDERFGQIQNQLTNDSASLDKRFEALARNRETYQVQLNDSLKRGEFDSRMGLFQEKLESLGKTNIPLWMSFAGLLASMVVGLWVILGLKIDATNQPTVISLEQTKIANESRDRSLADFRAEFKNYEQNQYSIDSQQSRDLSNLQQITEVGKTDRGQLNERVRRVEASASASSVADADSKTDRSQLNDRFHQLEANMANNTAERRANEASFKASLVEIETQFCGSDSVRSLMHAEDLRIMAILWAHAGLGEYPTANAFYAQVCNRQIDKK